MGTDMSMCWADYQRGGAGGSAVHIQDASHGQRSATRRRAAWIVVSVTENDRVTRGSGRYAGTGCKTDFDLPPILQVLITLGLTGMCTSVRPWTMMDEVTLCQEPASGLRSILRSSLAIWTCIMEAVQHA